MRGSRGPRSLPDSHARARSALSLSRPKRCAPKAFGRPSLPRRSSALTTSSTRPGGMPRMQSEKRLPARCPVRSLFPWRRASWIVIRSSVRARARDSIAPVSPGGTGTDTVCVVTATLSFIPATPMSRPRTSSALAMARTAASVVRSRFVKRI